MLALQLVHSEILTHAFVLQAALSGQIADKNLDSSQKFSLGGPNGVMGYAVGDGGGDDGYLADLELSHRVPLRSMPGALHAGVLAQYGMIHVNHQDYLRYGSRNHLTEAAFGTRFTYAWRGWQVTASYGWRIGSHDRSGAASASGGEFWASIGKSFEGLGD